jgi:hypothetical protein
MTNQLRLGWAALMVACSVSAACIPFEESREEFCQNADPSRRQEFCPTTPDKDGGTEPTLDAGIDGGTQPTGCKATSECTTPQPGQCLDSGSCVDGHCVYSFKEDGSDCSGTSSEQCRESTGLCKSGTCEYIHKTNGDCNDGNACTTSDTCNSAGSCAGTTTACNAPPSQCHEPAGVCSNGQCSYAFKAHTASCDDGNPCTVNDVCDGAGVCAGTTLSCNTPPGQCHEWAGTCSNNACNYRVKPGNSSCDDGNSCTAGDVCSSSGTCVGTQLSCNNLPSQCHEWAGTCSNNACNYRLKPTNSSCNDGNACTTSDVCNGNGVCAGAQLSCNSPPSQCHEWAGTCSNNACNYRLKPTNSSCNDGDSCTVTDTCNANGTCGGTRLSCTSPPSQCHEWAGTCSNNACDYRLKAAGSSCNDGNTCTLNDVCAATGTCAGTPLTCNAPPSQCHEFAGTCTNNACDYRLKAAGSSCNDSNTCTLNDVCAATGTCAGTPLTCNSPPSQCHEFAGTCTNNACDYRLKQAGAPCSTGNACTTGDACASTGECVSGMPSVCENDLENCQRATGCDPQFGCRYESSCRPGQFCCGDGSCAAGPCN